MRNPDAGGRKHRLTLLVSALACALAGAAQDSAPEPGLLFGGCGGLYLLAEPGELEIEVYKRDLNRAGRHTELRAILVGPDRRVVQEAIIPDDGQRKGPGPLQRVKLSTRVLRKGVYALNVTVSQDRYGQNLLWGFRTNCPRYLVETARGHKDERHREPIVLAGSGKPAKVCFMPRGGEFDVGVTGLGKGAEALKIVDANGTLIRELAVDGGTASGTLPADVHRDAVPWCLHLPTARATVTIDAVTQWDQGDRFQGLCVWTPNPSSWFPLLEHRWLLTPYNTTVFGASGETKDVVFQLHNNSAEEQTMRLGLEFPDDSWPVHLEQDRVTLAAGGLRQVGVRFTVPRNGGTVHLRVTPESSPDLTTYSTLTVRAGDAPALSIPMQLKPYQHENALFGYLPDYPTGSQPYFDRNNRAFMVPGGNLERPGDGSWIATRLPGAPFTTKIAFDRDKGTWLIARVDGRAALLHSLDGGKTFEAARIPGRSGGFDLEQFSGHNVHEGPPPFVRFTRTAKDPNLKWRSLNDLELFVPRRIGGRVEVGDPILLSKACIGLSSHSGIPSSIVSRGTKVHVAWGEATDPKKKVPGVPTFVVSYDRVTGRLGKPALVGYGPPANDVHNSPSITMDSKGILHVLIGTHGRPFQHVMSKKSNDAGGGWTEPVTAGEGLRQTYIGLVCGPDDTLHVVFRLWQSGDPYPHSTHATLAYQRKPPGEPWEPPQILVRAPFSEYSIFYHRLTIDRKGRLFLSKDYWSTHWFYRNDQPGTRGHWRTLLMSPDGGDTWRMAQGDDLRGE